MPRKIKPKDVLEWFPEKEQQRYAKHLIGKSGLTPTQARHFVRLWGYGYLLQHGPDYAPITTLSHRISSFFCSQSEAAALFYTEGQGAPRSAGLMINKFVDKQLVRRERFSGSKTRISLYIPESFELPESNPSGTIYADVFNPRRDIPHIALLLEDLFSFDNKRPKSMLNNVRRGLRQWSQRYPPGLRVLRLSPKNNPIAFSTIFPIHQDSEIIFDLPPSQSLHLSRFHLNAKDPIQFASPGDHQCHIAYIRSWEIHPDFWNYKNALLMTQDTQATVREIYKDYPELSEVYSIAIHPRLAAFATTLGFEIMRPDPQTSLCWLYISLDSFLALEADKVLADFDYTLYT
ncbi:hypothetical protein [Leptothoe spongobia]|uniref:Uncharacterized protein n=1 Tax=Leptothoe spongobia TAU-MAC 1115 TaxID=1967444 RepID=A0A947GKK0_9CYAN|nr:hypothetical protein [Leptothoe spongobia]MBT9316482.1 hypothetical protein [Leptothoe spongobia TAU-MAC 1115]